MKSPGAILEIVRRSLESGHSVEIEGLGTFRGSLESGYTFEPQARPTVFVAYAVEDLETARKLSEALEAGGCSPWLDKDKLLPGQNWPRAIGRAIDDADAFVACFSPRSIAKRGQFQSELRYALECARRRPLDEVFVIPVRLERCSVPVRVAEQVQYVDLYPDWERGVKRVIRAARKAGTRRPAADLIAA